MKEKKFYEFTLNDEGYYWYPPFIPGFKRGPYFSTSGTIHLYSELEGIHVLIGKIDAEDTCVDAPKEFDYPIIVNVSGNEYFDDDVQVKKCADNKEFIEFIDEAYLKFKGFPLDEALGF